MHLFVMLMICAVMLADYLTSSFGLPRIVRFLPEILTFVAVLLAFMIGLRSKFRFVAAHYWLGFGFMLLIIVCGTLANNVEPGPTIAGMRYYFRAIPFFFLAAVCNFSDEQVKQQLKLMLLLAFVQVPTALYQRVVLNWENPSGDSIVGTVRTSSILSMFLICVVLLIVGLALRNRIGKIKAVLACFVLLIPTMINETKGTVVLLPFGILITLMVGARPGQRLIVAAWTAVLLVGFGAVFVPVYDFMQRNNPYPVPITEFFTSEEHLNRYVEQGHAGVGAARLVGRKDAVTISVDYLARDPTRLVFGLGMGNASESQLGTGFTGEYYSLFRNIVPLSSGAVFLLEIGLIGTAAVFLLHWLVFRDAFLLARQDEGLWGALAIGWAGIVAVSALGTFYKTTHAYEALSYLFWYVSGMIAAKRVELAGAAGMARTAELRAVAASSSLQPALARQRLQH